MNLNHNLKIVGRRICLMRFSESTCSGVSKNSNLVKVRELLGQLVPQHDVQMKCPELVVEHSFSSHAKIKLKSRPAGQKGFSDNFSPPAPCHPAGSKCHFTLWN
jgi:hypothetical protein